MLARLWRWIFFGVAVLAIAWVWVLGRQGHWVLAIGGALGWVSLHAWALALQCVAMVVVNHRHPSAPALRGTDVLRAWWAETLVCVRVFGIHQAFREHALVDQPGKPGRRGIVFIHGYMCNRGLWLRWFQRLRSLGVPYTSVSLEPVFASIDAYVEQVEAAVRRLEQATGLAPVLVCHSMGGLVARAWLRWQAPQDLGTPGRGDARVHHVITVGTPHQGTWAARAAHTRNGQQMRLHSPWLRALADSETLERRRRFTCFYSLCDNIVFPASMALLPDAQIQLLPGCAHVQMLDEAPVFEMALRWVEEGDPPFPANAAK